MGMNDGLQWWYGLRGKKLEGPVQTREDARKMVRSLGLYVLSDHVVLLEGCKAEDLNKFGYRAGYADFVTFFKPELNPEIGFVRSVEAA
jgi:hypothetical protein